MIALVEKTPFGGLFAFFEVLSGDLSLQSKC